MHENRLILRRLYLDPLKKNNMGQRQYHEVLRYVKHSIISMIR